MAGPFKMKGFSGFGNSPMKHGDGTWRGQENEFTDVEQKRLDIKKAYYDKHGSSSGGSDEEWNAYQAELKALNNPVVEE
jgi:hypothetical protein